MQDEQSVLEAIIIRNQNILNSLMKQMEETQQNIATAKDALQLINKEKTLTDRKKEQPALPSKMLSDKYSKSSLRGAIRDVLKSQIENYLNAQEVYDYLIKYGFRSKSKNIKRDVYINLYTMTKTGQLMSIEEGGRKKYTMKK